jgi:hypothetical protein
MRKASDHRLLESKGARPAKAVHSILAFLQPKTSNDAVERRAVPATPSYGT